MPDLIAGRSDMMFEAYGSGGAQIRSGRLKALGVTSAKRLAVLPDVPTLAEQGVPNYAYDLSLGLRNSATVASIPERSQSPGTSPRSAGSCLCGAARPWDRS